MLPRLRVPEPLGQAEIDEVDVGGLLVADEEVVWFDVPVQVVAGLNVLDSLQL